MTCDPAKLTRSTGLLFVDVVEFGQLGESLPVRHLGPAGFHFGLVLALHALNVHLQVKFTHAGDNRFVCFFVHKGPEGGVFLGEPLEGLGHIGLGVSDMKKSLEFYRDFLGMTVLMELDITDDRIGRVIGVKGATCKIAHLQLGDGVLELFE